MRVPHPYDDAPRLPEGDHVDVRQLVQGTSFELEVGPGRGGFLIERAVAAPDVGLVGLEIRRKWATLVDRRLEKQGHRARARVFCEDAKLALPRLGPDGVLARAFLHFPDPWWKKRHEKRLVMGDRFLSEIARLLAPGGELFIQSDVEDRVREYEAEVAKARSFVPKGDAPGSARVSENPYGARSPRERRAMADGLPIFRLLYQTPTN